MNELSEIQADMRRIASDLMEVQERVARVIQHGADITSQISILKYAKKYYQGRRTREKIFSRRDLFADPAWDILIDLFIAAEERKQVSVSSLCIAAAVPATTALRWIALLESEGMIERTADPLDARRYYVSLSDTTHNKIARFFSVQLSVG